MNKVKDLNYSNRVSKNKNENPWIWTYASKTVPHVPLEDVCSGINMHQGQRGYNEPNRAELHLIFINLWNIEAKSFYPEVLLSHLPLEKSCILTCNLKQYIAFINVSGHMHKKEPLKFKYHCLLVDQPGILCKHPGVSVLYARSPHLVLQLPLHNSHMRILTAQLDYWAPALSIAPHGIPSQLLCVHKHPVHPLGWSSPAVAFPLARAIIFNCWESYCLLDVNVLETNLLNISHLSCKSSSVLWWYLHLSIFFTGM